MYFTQNITFDKSEVKLTKRSGHTRTHSHDLFYVWLVYCVSFLIIDFANFNVDDPGLSVCLPLASDSSETMRHENTSRVNYIDIDLRSRSHRS